MIAEATMQLAASWGDPAWVALTDTLGVPAAFVWPVLLSAAVLPVVQGLAIALNCAIVGLTQLVVLPWVERQRERRKG